MDPPPLSHFPDLCLLAIFKYLSLSDLIRHIGLVCPNWARVQRDELKRRHSTTKHLVIVQNYAQCQSIREQKNPYESDLIEHVCTDNGLPCTQLPQQDDAFNTLLVPGMVLTESFTSALIVFLPNITHLTIFQNEIAPFDSVVGSLEQIVRLLNQYSTKLVSLRLHFISRISIQKHHYNYESCVCALFNAINRLASLRHLSLNVKFPNFRAHSRLRILSRLSTFTLHHVEPPWLLFASLCEYATAGDVRIDCNWAQAGRQLGQMAQFVPQIRSWAGRFIRTSFSFNNHDSTLQFCTLFSSLTTLNLKVSLPMAVISQPLSLLSCLISLSLNFKHIPKDTHQIEITQVPSVRLLILTIQTQSHHDTERLYLSEIFPQLQVLHLIHSSYQCSECQYELSNESEMAALIAHCMCLARQPFRACANLHTIKLDISRIFPSLPVELLTVDQWHAHDSHILTYKDESFDPIDLQFTTFGSIFSNILSFILSLLYICKLYKPQTV